MSKKDEALKLALEWLEYIDKQDNDRDFLGPEECCALDDTRNTIREALAERCVCGEPDTPGTHRTDGPCLAEQSACEHEWLRGGCLKCGQSIEQPAQQEEKPTTREDIIRMARKAGFTDHNGFCEVIVRHSNGSWIGVKDELERFAALVAAAKEAELNDGLTIAYMDGYEKGKDDGAAAEREACAYRAGIALLGADRGLANRVDQAIRARGQNL